MLGMASLYAYQGTYLQGVGFWDKGIRLRTYVTPGAYRFSQWLEDNNLDNLRYAADNAGAHYLLLGTLTDATVLIASPRPSVQSFIDLYEFFDPETSRERRLEIIEEYEFEGLMSMEWHIVEDILIDDIGYEAINPIANFWVLIPKGTMQGE
jgi:hypothetical protein